MIEYSQGRPQPGVSPLEQQAALVLDELSVEDVHDLLARVAAGTATPEQCHHIAQWGHAAVSVVHSIRNIISGGDGNPMLTRPAADVLRHVGWCVGLDNLPPDIGGSRVGSCADELTDMPRRNQDQRHP